MGSTAIYSAGPRRYLAAAGIALVMGWGFSSTTATQHVRAEQRSIAAKAKSHIPWLQTGRASWYGDDFQGQPTASGEAYDMNKLTCAHRSLPLGSLVRVTNLHNHRSVVVRVNDRGPMVPSRIVDLSYAAARVLGFRGMARVRIELIDPTPTSSEVAQLTWPKLAKH